MESSQENRGVDFSIDHDLQHFRLLELPPSLVNRMTSECPPILYFKSEPTPVSKNATVPPNAVLCTDDETFEVQQVQSSDSLYILQPVQNTTSTHGEYSDTGGVSVMAECNMILEVVARPTSAVPYLKRRIPVYDMSQLEARMLGKGNEFSDTGQIIDKQELLDNSSSCLKELDKGLVELCVYYTEKYAWRPSEAVLIAAWRSFMSAVTVKGLRINQSLQMSEVADLMMEDGFTLSLIQAFFQRLAPKIDDAEDDREATSAYRDNCVPWVGSLLLRTLPLTGDTVQGFMSRWRDTLPEVWQEHAILELLQGNFSMTGENPTIIKSVVETETPKVASPKPKGTSRWHGKFKVAGQ